MMVDFQTQMQPPAVALHAEAVFLTIVPCQKVGRCALNVTQKILLKG